MYLLSVGESPTFAAIKVIGSSLSDLNVLKHRTINRVNTIG